MVVCLFYRCCLESQLCTGSNCVCSVLAGSSYTIVSSALGGSAVPCREYSMPVPSGKEKKTDPWGYKKGRYDKLMSKIKLMSHCFVIIFFVDGIGLNMHKIGYRWITDCVYILVFLYHVLLSISSHSQWSVGDFICLVLEGFKGHGGRSTPLRTLNDRSDATTLVCGVDQGQSLGVRATYWTYKIHHLEARRGQQKGIIT